MYIQDSTLASAFDNAAAEYIEQTEAELLAEYKSISNIANSKKSDSNLLIGRKRLSQIYRRIL